MANRHFKIFIAFLISFFFLQMYIYSYNVSHDFKYKQQVSTQDAIKHSVFIDIEERTLYLLRNGQCIKTYPVAVGKYDTPSPIGCWKIIAKSDWGEGFGGRWMGLNVTWGKYQQEHHCTSKGLLHL